MIDQNTKEVFDKAFELIKQGVVAAADTLKTYAPQLWAMVRRQVILDGMELVAGGLITFIIGLVAIHIMRRRQSERPRISANEPDQQDINVATGFVVAVMVVLMSVFLLNAADFLLNPDFWTLKRVMELRN